MTYFIVELAAERDLDEIFEEDEDSAAVIDVLLEEFCNHPEWADLLEKDRTRRIQDPAFENQKFEEAWRKGYFFFRLKLWNLDGGLVPYRILHATDRRTDNAHIFGIFARDIAYDINHTKVQRCFTDYDVLGIYRGV